MGTYLIIELRVNLRCRLVQDDHVTAPQDRTGHRNELAFSSTEGSSLADRHIQRECDIGILGALQRALEYGSKVTSFKDVPALLIRVLIERVQIASKSAGKKGNVLADDGLQYPSVD